MCKTCKHFDSAFVGTSFETPYCRLSGETIREGQEECKEYCRKGAEEHVERIKALAFSKLGRQIADAEWESVLFEANRKLDRIIDRTGNSGGLRNTPEYIACLIEEIVLSGELSRYCQKAIEAQVVYQGI